MASRGRGPFATRPCPSPSIGAAVPPGSFNMNGNGNDDPPGFYGDPPVDQSKTSQELLAETKIPWQAVLNGTGMPHDFAASQGYPNFSFEVGADEWPVIYLDSDSYQVGPTHSGRGMLVAEGDLVMNGAFTWKGLILAGGAVTSNGQQTIEGAVVAGLDMLLGENVEASNLGNGNWRFQYHSCNVLKALKGAGAPAEEPGTWFDVL